MILKNFFLCFGFLLGLCWSSSEILINDSDERFKGLLSDPFYYKLQIINMIENWTTDPKVLTFNYRRKHLTSIQELLLKRSKNIFIPFSIIESYLNFFLDQEMILDMITLVDFMILINAETEFLDLLLSKGKFSEDHYNSFKTLFIDNMEKYWKKVEFMSEIRSKEYLNNITMNYIKIVKYSTINCKIQNSSETTPIEFVPLLDMTPVIKAILSLDSKYIEDFVIHYNTNCQKYFDTLNSILKITNFNNNFKSHKSIAKLIKEIIFVNAPLIQLLNYLHSKQFYYIFEMVVLCEPKTDEFLKTLMDFVNEFIVNRYDSNFEYFSLLIGAAPQLFHEVPLKITKQLKFNQTTKFRTFANNATITILALENLSWENIYKMPEKLQNYLKSADPKFDDNFALFYAAQAFLLRWHDIPLYKTRFSIDFFEQLSWNDFVGFVEFHIYSLTKL